MTSVAALEKKLVDDCRSGSVTLVLGAGVSISSGVPSWRQLLAGAWNKVHGAAPVPMWLVDAGVGLPHPMALQILLENLEERLRPSTKAESDPVSCGRRKLADIVRNELYASADLASASGSLAHVVEAIRTDQSRSDRRIAQVISFNADDLLERFANFGYDHDLSPVVWPVSRPSFHPRRGPCANGRPPIPIYHIHGYLPSSENPSRDAPDTLVFTDAQYWDSVGSPASFANRVVGSALHESHCIFLGVSMNDINLMRWLGNYASEVQRDKLSEFTLLGKSPRQSLKAAGRALRRHYWVRAESSDDQALLKSHLLRRGVYSVPIPDWDVGFAKLIGECFGS